MCLLAAVLALGFVRLGVEKTMPDYPDSLGDSLAPEKITGEYLLRTAAAQDDTLPVFGSSELKTTQICTHPANFFAGKRCGFQVDLIGRGSCQCSSRRRSHMSKTASRRICLWRISPSNRC